MATSNLSNEIGWYSNNQLLANHLDFVDDAALLSEPGAKAQTKKYEG